MPKGINRIVEQAGVSCLIFLEPEPEAYVTSSAVVRKTLMLAFALNASVDLDVFDRSHLIKRIDPFQVSKKPEEGRISRLATQLTPQGNILELFVIKDSTEQAFRVLDEALQDLCLSAVINRASFKFTEVNKEIVAAELDDLTATQRSTG
jgi:hypothetical protein